MTIPFVNTNKVRYNFVVKIKSYVFLFVITLILIFILGVRYGQNVEKNNKVVNYLLSITPTPKPPTPTPVKYKGYKSKKWGLKFTYPADLEVKESSKASEILFTLPSVIPSTTTGGSEGSDKQILACPI